MVRVERLFVKVFGKKLLCIYHSPLHHYNDPSCHNDPLSCRSNTPNPSNSHRDWGYVTMSVSVPQPTARWATGLPFFRYLAQLIIGYKLPMDEGSSTQLENFWHQKNRRSSAISAGFSHAGEAARALKRGSRDGEWWSLKPLEDNGSTSFPSKWRTFFGCQKFQDILGKNGQN